MAAGTLAQSAAAMRVLLLHNRYRRPGGEERAVDDIAALLRARGNTVEVLERSSADAGRLKASRGMLRGGIDPLEVEHAVARLQPDVVHAHNVHPLFGWRALAAARAGGARTVLHLHNFRLFCAIAIGYRDGGPCFRCTGRDTRPGLRLRCRGSVAEAAVYAAGLSRQQPRLYEHVDRFVAVSRATAARLAWLGLPRDAAITVLPNFVFEGALASASTAGEGEYALVAGRLVEEKGFDTAIAAARAAGVPLMIAGEGPDEDRLRALASSASGGAGVRFVGQLDASALADARARAAVVLAPSRWEEPCPYAVLDALAAGIPVLASDRGGLPELVGPESCIPAEDVAAWARALRELWADPARRVARGEEGLDRARELFGEARYYEQLMDAYGAEGTEVVLD
jgi:glycosyltransferase involved in cell wall biosynthesis